MTSEHGLSSGITAYMHDWAKYTCTTNSCLKMSPGYVRHLTRQAS